MQRLSSSVAATNILSSLDSEAGRPRAATHPLRIPGAGEGRAPGAEFHAQIEAKFDPDCCPGYASSGHSGWPQEHAISTSSFPASRQMSPQ